MDVHVCMDVWMGDILPHKLLDLMCSSQGLLLLVCQLNEIFPVLVEGLWSHDSHMTLTQDLCVDIG